MRRWWKVLYSGGKDFIDDDCMSAGASLAFYTVIALPPLMVCVFLIAGAAGVPAERIDDIVRDQLGMPDAPVEEDGEAAGYGALAARTQETRGTVGEFGWPSRVLGLLLLAFSASGVFLQLQKALNRAWEVIPDPNQGGVKEFIGKRLLSFGMIVVIAFLLLVSLVLTTLVDEILHLIVGQDPGLLGQWAAHGLNAIIGLLVATLLFASIFKFLPDARIAWRDVWQGALFTGLLFVIGKSLMSWWLQRGDVGGGWGSAATSMIATLLWVYYSSLILLFGAEVTQAWAETAGKGIIPEAGAMRMVERSPEAEARAQAAQEVSTSPPETNVSLAPDASASGMPRGGSRPTR